MARLSAYNAKRDFKQTREPRGVVGRGRTHSFVVQRHAATRLHYDLRLELDGVYKSWAVTKPPSLDPAVKRLAVEVEDHPVAYGTFEGTIPQGQYGSGTVQLWDRGTWTPLSDDPGSDLAAGHLKFEIDGKRMKGHWALVRMRDDPARPGRKVRHNWLLIKEIDDEARRGTAGDALAKAVASVKTGRTLDEIADKSRKVWNSRSDGGRERQGEPCACEPKGRRCREEETKGAVLAQARMTAMPQFVPPQLARLVKTPPSGPKWIHEVKFDGYRMQMRVEKGRAVLRTRKGLDWTDRFPEIATVGDNLTDCIVDGEICALTGEGVSDFGRLQVALSDHKTGALVYYAFDCLFAKGTDLSRRPLRERKDALKRLLPARAAPCIQFVPHFKSSGDAMLTAACKMDLEGVVSKRIDAPYVSGRADSWAKSKCRGGQEVVIGAWRGTTDTLRSLLVGTYQNGTLTYMGRVGTGYSAKVASDLLARLKPLRRKTPPFRDAPRAADLNWVEPRLVAEIEFENVTSDGLFRQAAFKGLRLDKPAKAVMREVPADASKEEKPMVPKKKGKEEDTTVLGIVISHPDKVLWPQSKLGPAVTKRELALYMAAAAERMLPHVANRPISVVRAPDGIGGQLFYQRHELKGTAAPMLAIKVKGEKQPYLGVADARALVALAQQAVMEIHPWGSKPGDPETPERIILDLDPAPDVPFARVVEGAKELRKRLVKLGFEPFVKTTGGKGLHVVVAIKGTPKRPADWPDAKAFAKAVAMQMEQDMPERYTTNLAKKARAGKIFIDYLRNDRTSTGVAPWSVRAREGATVAIPLDWAALKAALDPHKFNIRTAPALLKKKDPWSGLAASATPLPPRS